MIKKYLPFVLISVLLFSCEPTADNTIPCDPNAPKNIQTTNPEPDLYATSVDTWVLNPYADSPCYYPSGPDSTAYIYIDIDNDTIDDFSFAVHQYNSGYPNTPASACIKFGYSVKIISLISGDRIVTIPGTNNYADNLDTNDVVGHSSNFSNSDETYIALYPSYSGGSQTGHAIASGENILGFKITRNGNLHYGWIKIEGNRSEVTVKSWGYDANTGNCINAGEQ